MKILMLCPMLSSSSMITVYPMAKALSKKHDVKLVGPLLGGKPFIEDDDLEIKFIEPCISRPQQLAMLELYHRNMKRLMKYDFDVIHAFKLLPHTAPVASAIKKRTGKKFILSIDDYDAAASRNPIKRAVMKCAEHSYRNADAITVSSTYLQKLYGGEIMYQVPNEQLFISKKHDGKTARKRFGLEGKKIILYAGTFYEHKGIDVLIRAVQSLKRNDVKLVLAGDGGNEQKLRSIAGSETIFTGRLPMERVAELTAACDIYAIPTKDTEYARAEIPGKIFEPMMLGKPIIASRISDIPLILDNGKCGSLVKPGDEDSLTQAIVRLVDNPKDARNLGRRAKARYSEKYCMREFEKKLNRIYDAIESGK